MLEAAGARLGVVRGVQSPLAADYPEGEANHAGTLSSVTMRASRRSDQPSVPAPGRRVLLEDVINVVPEQATFTVDLAILTKRLQREAIS